MPITKSAKKALRQSLSRRATNLKIKRAYKQAIKEAVLAQGKKGQEKLLSIAQGQIDKAAKRRVLHQNKAARLKSKLALKLSQKKR